MVLRWFVSAAFLGTAFTGFASARFTPVSCSSGNVNSTIEVIYTHESKNVPCNVQYTRGATVKSPYNAKNQEGVCEEGAKKLIANLEKNHYKCSPKKEIKATPLTEATPVTPEKNKEEPKPQ